VCRSTKKEGTLDWTDRTKEVVRDLGVIVLNGSEKTFERNSKKKSILKTHGKYNS
jgi:hypothetical protein